WVKKPVDELSTGVKLFPHPLSTVKAKNIELPATYRPYGLIEVGNSWEQSVLYYGGVHHSQRFLLFTKLPPQSLRFFMGFSYADACMRSPSTNMFLLAFISLSSCSCQWKHLQSIISTFFLQSCCPHSEHICLEVYSQ